LVKSNLTFRSFLERAFTSEDDEKEDDEEEKDKDEKNTKYAVNMKLFIAHNIPGAWSKFIRGKAGKYARRYNKVFS
jgi:hypothetical protein